MFCFMLFTSPSASLMLSYHSRGFQQTQRPQWMRTEPKGLQRVLFNIIQCSGCIIVTFAPFLRWVSTASCSTSWSPRSLSPISINTKIRSFCWCSIFSRRCLIKASSFSKPIVNTKVPALVVLPFFFVFVAKLRDVESVTSSGILTKRTPTRLTTENLQVKEAGEELGRVTSSRQRFGKLDFTAILASRS